MGPTVTCVLQASQRRAPAVKDRLEWLNTSPLRRLCVHNTRQRWKNGSLAPNIEPRQVSSLATCTCLAGVVRKMYVDAVIPGVRGLLREPA